MMQGDSRDGSSLLKVGWGCGKIGNDQSSLPKPIVVQSAPLMDLIYTQAHEFFIYLFIYLFIFFFGGGSDVPYDIIMYFQPSSTLWIKLISLLPSMYSLSIYISKPLMKCQSWYLNQGGGYINLIFFCALSHFLMRMIKLYIDRNNKIITPQGNSPKKIEI